MWSCELGADPGRCAAALAALETASADAVCSPRRRIELVYRRSDGGALSGLWNAVCRARSSASCVAR